MQPYRTQNLDLKPPCEGRGMFYANPNLLSVQYFSEGSMLKYQERLKIYLSRIVISMSHIHIQSRCFFYNRCSSDSSSGRRAPNHCIITNCMVGKNTESRFLDNVRYSGVTVFFVVLTPSLWLLVFCSDPSYYGPNIMSYSLHIYMP